MDGCHILISFISCDGNQSWYRLDMVAFVCQKCDTTCRAELHCRTFFPSSIKNEKKRERTYFVFYNYNDNTYVNGGSNMCACKQNFIDLDYPIWKGPFCWRYVTLVFFLINKPHACMIRLYNLSIL